MSTPGATKVRSPRAQSAPRSAAPRLDPDENRPEGPSREDRPLRPYEVRPRGNPPLEQADLARGEEKLSRVLGW